MDSLCVVLRALLNDINAIIKTNLFIFSGNKRAELKRKAEV